MKRQICQIGLRFRYKTKIRNHFIFWIIFKTLKKKNIFSYENESMHNASKSENTVFFFFLFTGSYYLRNLGRTFCLFSLTEPYKK